MPLIPSDARLLQAGLPPLEQDWSERANKRAVLEANARNQDAMARANAAEAQQRERALAEANAMQRIAADAKGDWDVMIERATALNPELGAKLTKQRGDARAATAEAFTKELTAEQKRTERALSFLTVAQNDPELYDRIAPNIAALLPEELQAAMPRTHDPAKIEFLLGATVDAGKRMDRAAKLHDQVLSGDAFKGVLGQLAEQDTEEEWNGVINTYAAFLPKGTLALLPKWGPDAQAKAAAMAMTPAQKADDARQNTAQAITLAGQAESQRHNRAMEGQQAATERRLAAQAASGGGDNGPLQAIVGPDGKPVLVARRDAIGKQPATGGAAAGAKTGPDVGAIMGEIDGLSKKINTSGGGPQANLGGYMRKGLSKANWDNDVSEYETLVTGMIPMVARAVGHTGVLTQQDVDSVRALFPVATDSQTLAQNKMARVKRLIGGGAAAPPASTSAPSGTKRRDIKGGGVAELRDGKWIRVE